MCYRYVVVIDVSSGALNRLYAVVNVIRYWDEVLRYRNATRRLGYRLRGECKQSCHHSVRFYLCAVDM